MANKYKTIGYALAVGVGMLASPVSPSHAEEGLEFKKGNISSDARTLAPLLLESKFKAER